MVKRAAGSKGTAQRTAKTSKPAVKKAKSAAARAAPPAVAAKQAGPGTPASASGPRAKIRMYRQGLGDCFLIAIPRKTSAEPYRILIDCGVVLGTPDAAATMTKVVEDVVQESGGKIDLLLATHEHWDHLSGFIQASSSFAKLKVGDVWVAWTEDPKDELANTLRGERHQALSSLRLGVGAMRMVGDAESAGEVEELLGFFGAAGGPSTGDALTKVKASATSKLRFCLPSDAPVSLDGADVRLFILGPPHDEKLIRQTLPSNKNPETYGIAAKSLSATVMAGLSTDDDSAPFGDLRSIPIETAAGLEFFQRRYFGPGPDAPSWRRIDGIWLDGASELALALDSATNNTSLVLAIELAAKDVLLFAADAQVGNWLSWQDLRWTVDGREVTGPDLLQRTIFYKVGHHGSHNATLREKGLELMKRLSIAAIPVDHEMAVKKNWGKMPLPDLVQALQTAARDGVIRSDQAPEKLPPNVTATPLYFDIVF
jgi:beta-lactamase superfamily II metal-dependent hydrolase